MVVIIETHTEPINPPSASPTITHEQFWEGLVYQLSNTHKFVPTSQECKVLSHTEEEIVISQTLGEHSTLGHDAGEHKNKFVLSPPSKYVGTDTNTSDFQCIGIIAQGPGGEKDLYYTVVYEWNEKGVQKGSAEHEEKKTNNLHPRDLATTTVERIRQMVKDDEL
ncbi:MAG: hypothetical protein Q9161_006553 [Pseudevernia consocians]